MPARLRDPCNTRRMRHIAIAALLPLTFSLAALAQTDAAKPAAPKPQAAEMSGYMLVGCDKVPIDFNAGFSLYAAAWPHTARSQIGRAHV